MGPVDMDSIQPSRDVAPCERTAGFGSQMNGGEHGPDLLDHPGGPAGPARHYPELVPLPADEDAFGRAMDTRTLYCLLFRLYLESMSAASHLGDMGLKPAKYAKSRLETKTKVT